MRISSSAYCLLSRRYGSLRQSLSRKPGNTLQRDKPDINMARIPERVVSEEVANKSFIESHFEELVGVETGGAK